MKTTLNQSWIFLQITSVFRNSIKHPVIVILKMHCVSPMIFFSLLFKKKEGMCFFFKKKKTAKTLIQKKAKTMIFADRNSSKLDSCCCKDVQESGTTILQGSLTFTAGRRLGGGTALLFSLVGHFCSAPKP